jgi:hypothetical protein
MGRLTGRVLIGVLLGLAVLYLSDWAVWTTRGHRMDRVTVNRVQVAQLKGNKEEYFEDGTTQVECSRSIFPQAGAEACWWVRRHNAIFER